MTTKQLIFITALSILTVSLGFFSQNFLNTTKQSSPLSPLSQINYKKVTLLNFWATWCPPCRKEIPDFIRLYEEFKDQDFTIVGLAIDKTDKVKAFEKKVGINYLSLIAEKEGYSLLEKYGSPHGALPYTVILNKQGDIIYKHHKGILSYKEAKKIIESLL